MLVSTKIPTSKLHLTRKPKSNNNKHHQTKQIELSQYGLNKEVNDLKSGLKACRYSYLVKTLSISQIFSPKILDLFSERIKSLASLESVNISFGRSDGITNAGLEKLSQGLKEFSQLKKMTISCHHREITDNGIRSLGKALKRLVLLQELKIDLQECNKISDLGLKELSHGLGKCKMLKKLELRLSGSEKVTNQGLDSLSEAILKLKSLESIKIDFQIDGQGAHIGLKSLSESLGSLGSLKSLELKFAGCRFRSIKDEDMGHLKEGLKKLKSLRSIGLEFLWCGNITETGFKDVCEGVAELESLKSLRLEFPDCNTIREQGLVVLGEGLPKMNLENIYLNFFYCPNVTENGFNELKKGLLQLRNIKKLRLFLICAQGLKKTECVQELKTHFNITDISID